MPPPEEPQDMEIIGSAQDAWYKDERISEGLLEGLCEQLSMAQTLALNARNNVQLALQQQAEAEHEVVRLEHLIKALKAWRKIPRPRVVQHGYMPEATPEF